MSQVAERQQGSFNDFFEMIRRLERQSAAQRRSNGADGFDSLNYIGTDALPSDEAIRFKSSHGLGFSGSAIDSLKALLESEIKDSSESQNINTKNEVAVNFMGVAGPSGVLPQHYSRLILERIKQKDFAMVDFFDLFNHRLIALFYRSWIKYRFALQREYFDLQNQNDPFSNVIGSLAGKHQQVDHTAQLYYAGHFSKKNRSAKNLETMLSDFLKVPVNVISLVGNWLQIDKKDRARLSTKTSVLSQQLGQGIMLGKRSWDVNSKIAIHLGPMDYKTYRQFLPETEVHQKLKQLIESYVPVHINIDLFFKVNNVQQHRTQLGGGMRLKQDVWLHSQNKSDSLTSKISFKRAS